MCCGTFAPPRCMRAEWTSKQFRRYWVIRGFRPRPGISTSTMTTSSTPGRMRTFGSPPAWAGMARWANALEPADEGRRTRDLEIDGDAPSAGRGGLGDQRGEDVGAVDRHPDHDPA